MSLMTRREREELVDQLLWRAWAVDARQLPKHRKPGQVIEALKPETRQKLEQLTAADFQHRYLGDWH